MTSGVHLSVSYIFAVVEEIKLNGGFSDEVTGNGSKACHERKETIYKVEYSVNDIEKWLQGKCQ